MQKMMNMGSKGSSGRLSMEENEDEEISRLEISEFRDREEEIEKKKKEVREKVEHRMGQAEEETRRLTQIWEELEALADPTRKDAATVHKKIDMANRELKSIGKGCQKKEKEYKDALEAFNEKNREKTQLVTTLMELLTESENLRMTKLEELRKDIEYLQ